MSEKTLVRLTVLLSLLTAGSANADWQRFRGPNGSGVAVNAGDVPVEWSDKENLKWKFALPGPGHSCPIVVGDKVFVTAWSGYGLERRGDPGKQQDLRRHLLCIDKNTGKEIWKKTIEPFLPEDQYGGMFAEHGYASHTPVSDGERVYVFFGKTGALAFDLAGNQIWKQSVGTESGARNWGTASSPILYKNLLIVPATAESEALVALDKLTGEEVWRAEAAGFNSTWGTPILVKVDDERTDIVMAVPYEIWAFNPDTGKLRWYCDGPSTNSFCSSVVASGQTVYAIETGMGGGGGIAVKAGGKGMVTDSHVVWTGRQSNRIGTPILFDGKLYTISNKTVSCFDAASGDEIYRKRLSSKRASEPRNEDAGDGRRFGRGGGRGGGQDYSSAIIANGNIYYVARNGEMFVLKVGNEFEQLATNRVTHDTEDFSSTPAVSDGMLFVRSSKHLYCIAHD